MYNTDGGTGRRIEIYRLRCLCLHSHLNIAQGWRAPVAIPTPERNGPWAIGLHAVHMRTAVANHREESGGWKYLEMLQRWSYVTFRRLVVGACRVQHALSQRRQLGSGMANLEGHFREAWLAKVHRLGSSVKRQSANSLPSQVSTQSMQQISNLKPTYNGQCSYAALISSSCVGMTITPSKIRSS